MAIALTATGDSCGVASGFAPNGTYYAFGCWVYLNGTAVNGGIIGFSNTAGTSYVYLSQATTTIIADHTGGTGAILTHSTATWYWMYMQADGSDLVAGIATPTGAFTTWSLGGSPLSISSPTNAGFGSYVPGDTTYGKNWRVQNGMFWSGASASEIPTVAELQAQRTRLRPMPMVGGGSTLLMPYAWYPSRNLSELGDLSGGGRALTGTGLDTADGPPIPWGAAPPMVGGAGAAEVPADYGTPYDHDGVKPFSSLWRAGRM